MSFLRAALRPVFGEQVALALLPFDPLIGGQGATAQDFRLEQCCFPFPSVAEMDQCRRGRCAHRTEPNSPFSTRVCA